MHGNHRIATRNEIEGTRLVETMTGQVQAVEVVAGDPQAFEKIEPMFVAGDQTRLVQGFVEKLGEEARR